MRTFFIGFLILAAVLVGGSVVANVAYQAGVQTAVTTVAATAPEGTVVTPVAVPAYGYGYGYGPGWGWHGGFSFFGILFGLFILFLFFGLLRAAFGRGRGWGGRGGPGGWGYGGGGPGGWSGHDHNGDRPWERQAREIHDAWHRENPGEAGGPSGSGGTASGGAGASAATPPTDRPSTGPTS
jgi:hypothetical protein